jgi:tetratricopeptide (TPR) repeat protein
VGKDSSPAVVACWSLAVERANELAPAGLAWPALALTALLDAGGVPGQVLLAPAACRYVAGAPGPQHVRSAIRNLIRLGLATVDRGSVARTVRTHASAWPAVRAYLPPAELDQVVAAASLLHVWADPSPPALLDQALRDGAAQVREIAGERLWRPDGHAVLFRAGQSLDRARLPATAYWQLMADIGSRLLGAGHPQAVRARGNVAAAYETAGRLDEAVTVLQSLLAEREAALGPQHPATLAVRASLAHAYQSAGRTQDAIPRYERTLAGRAAAQGPDHPDTLAARASLAYQSARRLAEAIPLYERALAGFDRVLGPGHPDTLTSRANLASAYHTAGRAPDAIRLLERALADCEAARGPDDPMIAVLRENLDALQD